MVLRAATMSFLLLGALSAQTVLTVPLSHAGQEGTASTNVPFGRSTPTRVQYVYDGALFSGPVTITAVAFRLDGGALASGKVVDCEFWMSTLPVPLVGLQTDFAGNRGSDAQQVLARQFLTLPAQGTTATPNAFLPAIPLTMPFAYDPAAGGLVLEIVVHGQPPGAYSLDVTYACDSPDVPVGPAGCAGSSGSPIAVGSASAQVMWGRPWVVQTTGALPGTIVLLIVGSIDSGPWGGFVLPQDLTAIGATGCHLSIDITTSWVGIAAGDGSVQFPFQIPNNPAVLGLWLRFQAGAFDAVANPLGLVTSQAKKVQVCGWEPVGRLWSNGVNQQFGTREIGLAAVVQFTVQ